MRENIMHAAVCQWRIGEGKEYNLRRAEELLRAAAARGAQLAVLPEMFFCPYQPEAISAAAEPEGGPTARRLAAWAGELKLLLVAGSLAERDDRGRIYNTSLVFSPQGVLLGRQRKNHLFDVDIPDRVYSAESAVITPGVGVQAIAWQGLKLAVNICFDLRFPAMAQAAAGQGTGLLCVPAQFSAGTGPAHWELLLRARAVDYQIFVVGANAAYDSAAVYQSWGHSMIVDPWGDILAAAGEAEEIIMAELDFARLAQVRRDLGIYGGAERFD